MVCTPEDTERLQEFGSLFNAFSYMQKNSMKVYGVFYLAAVFMLATIPLFVAFGFCLALGAPLMGLVSLVVGVCGLAFMSLFRKGC